MRNFNGWGKNFADEQVKIFRREDFACHKVSVVFWQTDENDQPANVAKEQEFYCAEAGSSGRESAHSSGKRDQSRLTSATEIKFTARVKTDGGAARANRAGLSRHGGYVHGRAAAMRDDPGAVGINREADQCANEVINVRVISIGLIDRSPVHPREVFADAVADRASGIIVAHNHPAGSLEPSSSDTDITRQFDLQFHHSSIRPQHRHGRVRQHGRGAFRKRSIN